MVIHIDVSIIDIIETHQQIDDGCLTSTGWTYNRNGLSSICFQIQIVQNDSVFQISKGYIFHADITFDFIKAVCIFDISRFFFFIQQTEDSFTCRKSGINLIEDIGNFIDWTGEFTGVEDKTGNTAKSYCTIEIQDGTPQAD